MPDVSVLTALASRPQNRLEEIHRSLVSSRAGWEWLLQIDGDRVADVPDAVRADERVRIEVNGQQLGIAVSRNRALARAAGSLLLNADSDDVPVPGALDQIALAFDDPSVGLAFGDWVEHWPDGRVWRPEARFAPGRQEPGAIGSIWAAERWVPMHLAGAMWRADAVRAAGGWTALVGGSDIGLMLGVDARWASHYTATPTFTYHHHQHQTTAAARWHDLFDHDLQFLAARARALGHGAA